MGSLTALPCEVIAAVLRDLGNIRFLLPSLLACRHLYSSFAEHPGVAADIIERQVTPDLVPYAVTTSEASRLRPGSKAAARELLETLYMQPSKLADRVRSMPIPALTRMGHTNEVIQSLAVQFASGAWRRLSHDPGSRVSGDLSLSSTEYFRFCRAFYRIELYFSLFRKNTPSDDDAVLDENDKEWFLSKHPPWENEQLGCAHDFLELGLSEACRDVLSHDVEFGELSVDYLTIGGENGWWQLLLSQGATFIYRLANERSYNANHALLKSAFATGDAGLYNALITPFGDSLNEDIPLAQYTDNDLTSLFPDPDSQDTNKGPYEGWRVAFNIWPQSAWVMLTNNYGLRERAYVFWALERLEKYGMLELFEDATEAPSVQHTDKDFDDMQESFRERSKVWQKGGAGYWSRDGSGQHMIPQNIVDNLSRLNRRGFG